MSSSRSSSSPPSPMSAKTDWTHRSSGSTRSSTGDEAADELDTGGQASFLLSASCCCAVASAFWSASSCCFALVTWTCAWCRLEAFDACCSAVAPPFGGGQRRLRLREVRLRGLQVGLGGGGVQGGERSDPP